MFRILLLCGIILSSTVSLVASLNESECPVCFKMVSQLIKDVTEDEGKLTADRISEAFLKTCKAAKKDSADGKFCYYMGGQEVSATRTYKDMAEKMSWGLPVEKVCENIMKTDPQICEIREKKPIDLKTVDLKKLKVADLKRLLKERGESCDGCLEKSEFIKKAEEIKNREEL